MVSSSRSLCGLQIVLFLPDWRRWEYPEWRDQQFRHHHYQRVWVFYTRYDSDAGLFFPLWVLLSAARVRKFSRAEILLLQKVPYGIFIAISILTCVFLNDRFTNKRCLFIVIFLLPNIAGSFGLRFLGVDHKVGRLICYYLTGPYNAAFVLVLSLQTANTAGECILPFVSQVEAWTKKGAFHKQQATPRKSSPTPYSSLATAREISPVHSSTKSPNRKHSPSVLSPTPNPSPKHSPTYSLGIWSMIVSHLVEVVLILTLGLLLARENSRRDRIQSQDEGGMEGRDLDATAFSDLTDRENSKYVSCLLDLLNPFSPFSLTVLFFSLYPGPTKKRKEVHILKTLP